MNAIAKKFPILMNCYNSQKLNRTHKKQRTKSDKAFKISGV